MRWILSILLFFTGSYSIEKKDGFTMNANATVSAKKYFYLALGDSYTIGEKVVSAENFPSQVVRRLREENLDLAPPRIIATTGWTTDELEVGIRQAGTDEPLRSDYDMV